MKMIDIKKFKSSRRSQVFLVVAVLLIAFVAKNKFRHEQKKDQLKAVLETSKEYGFRLSEIAVKTIGVNSIQVPEGSSVKIPESALVYSLDQIGVYRLRNQWFKFVNVKVLNQADESLISSKELVSHTDQIVINGSGLLRAAEMEAFGGEE